MNQEKKIWMLTLLEKAWVSVYLDPQKHGVVIPEEMRHFPYLVLQYGHQMPIPIPDLVINDVGISATLSFDEDSVQTFVPWEAVFGISDGEEQMRFWSKHFPTDLTILLYSTGMSEDSFTPKPKISKKEPEKDSKRRPAHLKLVD